MLESQLKKRILENDFIINIRHFQIRAESFKELCDSVSKLADIWKGQNQVDKELASELYGLVRVTQNIEKVMQKTVKARLA